MESETTLVRAKGAVELDTEGIVDLALSLVVLPGDTELDDALRDRADLEGLLVLGVLLKQLAVLEG